LIRSLIALGRFQQVRLCSGGEQGLKLLACVDVNEVIARSTVAGM